MLSSNKIQNGDILVPTYPGCPGKWPLKSAVFVSLVKFVATKRNLVSLTWTCEHNVGDFFLWRFVGILVILNFLN